MSHTIAAELVANVGIVSVKPGDVVGPSDTLVILESMKMEIPVAAPAAGKLKSILVAVDDVVAEGQVVAIIEI